MKARNAEGEATRKTSKFKIWGKRPLNRSSEKDSGSWCREVEKLPSAVQRGTAPYSAVQRHTSAAKLVYGTILDTTVAESYVGTWA